MRDDLMPRRGGAEPALTPIASSGPALKAVVRWLASLRT